MFLSASKEGEYLNVTNTNDKKFVMKRMNYKSCILFMIVTIFLIGCNRVNDGGSQIVSQDLVPDKETAVKIAEAIWLPMFGKSIYKYKPYNVGLENDSIWIVQGTLKADRVGGVPVIRLNKANCMIIEVYHSE